MQYLTPTELAARIRTSAQTLANWRVEGKGPRFAKFGFKVLYPLTEVETWEQQQLRRSTADSGQTVVSINKEKKYGS